MCAFKILKKVESKSQLDRFIDSVSYNMKQHRDLGFGVVDDIKWYLTREEATPDEKRRATEFGLKVAIYTESRNEFYVSNYMYETLLRYGEGEQEPGPSGTGKKLKNIFSLYSSMLLTWANEKPKNAKSIIADLESERNAWMTEKGYDVDALIDKIKEISKRAA